MSEVLAWGSIPRYTALEKYDSKYIVQWEVFLRRLNDVTNATVNSIHTKMVYFSPLAPLQACIDLQITVPVCHLIM